MNRKPLCIYHGGCADGFTAAWAVWKFFQGIDGCDFHAGVYQDAPPDVTDRDVILVDFSYKRSVLLDMRRKAASILILDHHKSAAEDLAPDGGFIDIRTYAPPLGWDRHIKNHEQHEGEGDYIYTLFDMERSGAGLAWDFFHANRPSSMLVDYVQDRDLWRFKLPESRAASAFIFSNEYTFEDWERLAALFEFEFWSQVVPAGLAIERKHHKDVAELVAENRYEMVIGGQWVPVCNLPKTLTSDAGHLMCAAYASANLQGEIVTPPFAACYWDTPQGRVFSLRSRDDGADVSAIAKLYGGGGHRNAAGFRLPHGVTSLDVDRVNG